MTVKITKPEINVREKISELDKPSGVAGQAMLAAETPQEQFNLIGAGRRNLIINGDFQVSQRGDFTSATTLTSSYVYYVDRWKARESQTTSTIEHRISNLIGDGSYANSLKQRATADGAAPVMQYYVEDYKVVWGRTFVVSFWYRSNNAWTYNMYNGTTQYHYQVPSSDNQWKKHTDVVTFPSNGNQLRIETYRFNVQTSVVSGDFFEFTQFQLELGKVATPFEHRSYGEELALCQRYYEVFRQNQFDGGDGFNTVTTATSNGSNIYGPLTFKVVKRARPSVGVKSGTKFRAFGDGSYLNLDATEFYSPGTEATRIRVTTNGFSAGQAACLEFDGSNSTNGYIYADAEL